MSLKVLTVDDSSTMRKMVSHLLLPYPVEILEANNGEVGLEVATKELPDLILLDQTMPVMDGLTMLTKLRENETTKHLNVIILSADSYAHRMAEAGHLGAMDFITKPFEESVFITKVCHALKIAPIA
jgi:two-component system cell cycle response regulator